MYQLIEPIGYGGYGEVFEAQKDGLIYAIKVINARDTASFLTEWSFLKMMSHPNIIPLHDAYVDPAKKTINLVMPLLEMSYHEFLDLGKPSEDDLRIILWQVLTALDYLHANRIVHRDLGVNNIMLVSRYNLEVKLIDFGTAKYLFPEQGTLWKFLPSYSSPEMKDGIYSTAMDMWSLGMMLATNLPHGSDKDRPHVPDESVEQSMAMCLGVSYELRNLIRGLLDPDYRRRLTASGALNHPWFLGRAYKAPDIIPIQHLEPLQDMMLISLGGIYSTQTIVYASKLASRVENIPMDATIIKVLLSMASLQMDEGNYMTEKLPSIMEAASDDWRIVLKVFNALGHRLVYL